MTDFDAQWIVRWRSPLSLRAGDDGRPSCDVGSVEVLPLGAGAVVAALDLNPVICGCDGGLIVDGRVRVEEGGAARRANAVRRRVARAVFPGLLTGV